MRTVEPAVKSRFSAPALVTAAALGLFAVAALAPSDAEAQRFEYADPDGHFYFEVAPGGYYESDPYIRMEFGEPVYRAQPYFPGQSDGDGEVDGGINAALSRIELPPLEELRSAIHHYVLPKLGIFSDNTGNRRAGPQVTQVPPPPRSLPPPTYGKRAPGTSTGPNSSPWQVDPSYSAPPRDSSPRGEPRDSSPRSDYVVVAPDQPSWVPEAQNRLRKNPLGSQRSAPPEQEPTLDPEPKPKPKPQDQPSPQTRPDRTASTSPTSQPDSKPESESGTEQDDDSPFAVPVPGKKGFVYSPFDKDKKLVDVRDLAPGTLARDPYTGNTFKVP
ncbi:hypothetical protein BH23VER1_BH23VER1_17930 [soil metagenome]